VESRGPGGRRPGWLRADRDGADVLSIARSRHTLEDVYLELVGDEEGGTR
jgi:hypothetical protein